MNGPVNIPDGIGSAHVLLVEDNEANRDMLSRRLKRKGFRVSFATDGPGAVTATQTLRPDIVLMDVDLPGCSGLDATESIRARADLQAIPVIALTAHALSGDRERALAAGCNEYETKPINFPRLLDKMAALLNARAGMSR